MTKTRFAVVFVMGPILAFAANCQAGYIVGVTSGTNPAPFVAIDPDTGAFTTLATVGKPFNALAANSAGGLYAGGHPNGTNGQVDRINPTTGATLQTYAITSDCDFRGMAFNSAGGLYAAINRNDEHGSPTLPDDLSTFDLGTGTATVIGSLGFKGVQALDFDSAGGLFAWDIVYGLLRVDPATGAATDANLTLDGTVNIQSIVFAPDGRLFGAGKGLYGINPSTGTYTPIGAGSTLDIRGIEWVVPEPATLSLLAVGGLMLSRRPRSSHRK